MKPLALATVVGPLFVPHDAVEVVQIEAQRPRWFRQVPVDADLDNVARCGPMPTDCADPIAWAWEPAPELRRKTVLDAVDLGPGTHRLRWEDRTRSGELEVVVRIDDTPAGYSAELLGLPFALWPAVLDGDHQTEARQATDCIALVVYGARRAGLPVPFIAPQALPRFTRVVRPDEPIQRGDVLDFGVQTAVISEDTVPLGVLDPTDRVLHAFHARAEEALYGELPYAGAAVTVRRWTVAARAAPEPL